MAWRQNKSINDNESKFNKFFKKKNESRFNNQIYDRKFNNENKDDLDNKKSNNKISYHKDFDPINRNNSDSDYKKSYFKNNNFKNNRSNYKSNFKNDKFKPNVEKKKPMIEILREEISNIEKQLSSNKYISKIKKDELENKIKELNIKLSNEFPSLSNNIDTNSKPKITCWNNLSNSKIYSDNTKNEVISKKNIIKIYEEHIESDYDGNDFIDDDKSCN